MIRDFGIIVGCEEGFSNYWSNCLNLSEWMSNEGSWAATAWIACRNPASYEFYYEALEYLGISPCWN